MPASQSEWDAKHRLAAEAPRCEPASIVRELLAAASARAGAGPRLRYGTAHAAARCARHQHVTAVDWSGAALDILESVRAGQALPVHRVRQRRTESASPRTRGIDLVQANLEEIDFLRTPFP